MALSISSLMILGHWTVGGYDQVSMSEVSAGGGVGKNLLYRSSDFSLEIPA